jgi:ADP-heptose:LPS heptosyltransferase
VPLDAVAPIEPMDVVVTAGPDELDLARQIVPEPVSGSLADLMDLVATARLVICGDTGVAHVATAYGTPSVLLFGPVSPDLWGPRRGPHRVLWHGETGDTFADEPDPGLLRITVQEVLEAIGGVLCEQSESESSARATSA